MQAQRPAARAPVRVQASAPVQAVSCQPPVAAQACRLPLACPYTLPNPRRSRSQTALKKENYIEEVPESLLRPGIDDPNR